MISLATFGRQAFATLICLSLVVWSVIPAVTHAPAVFETIHDHMEMIADHGHSHGFEEDLYWAMHGHSHDVADHDHGQVFLVPGAQMRPASTLTEPWLRMVSADVPSRQFRIDRPPRA